MSRSDYKICPICGSVLDIGERCDCVEHRARIIETPYQSGNISDRTKEEALGDKRTREKELLKI